MRWEAVVFNRVITIWAFFRPNSSAKWASVHTRAYREWHWPDLVSLLCFDNKASRRLSNTETHGREKKPVRISEVSVTIGAQNIKPSWQMGSMALLMSKLGALAWHFKQLSGRQVKKISDAIINKQHERNVTVLFSDRTRVLTSYNIWQLLHLASQLCP